MRPARTDRREFLRVCGRWGAWALASGLLPAATLGAGRDGREAGARRSLLLPAEGVRSGEGAGAGCTAPAVVTTRAFLAMGTVLDVEIQDLHEADAVAAIGAVRREVAEIEAALTIFRSEAALVRLAESPEGRWISASPLLIDALEEARDATLRTGGAFDPTVAPMMKSWGLSGPRLLSPNPRAWREWKRRPGWDAIELDRENRRIRRQDRRLEIDLGGIGKGIALEAAVAALREHGVRSGLVNFGGSLGVVGPPLDADDWSVGIAHPRERGQLWSVVQLRSGFLATSADDERFHLDATGRRHHHILDPLEGMPVAGVASMTVWSRNAVAGDVQSTAQFVRCGWEVGSGSPSGAELRLFPDSSGGLREEHVGWGPVLG